MDDCIRDYADQAFNYVRNKTSFIAPDEEVAVAVGALLYAAIRDLADAVDSVGGDIVSTSMMLHEKQ